jgi:hypothetical protein
MNRPEAMIRTLEAYRATTVGHDIEFVVAIDTDQKSYELARDWLYSKMWPNFEIVFNFERRGALACWNQALAKSKGDYLHPIGDDQLPRADWLTLALEAHRNKLGGSGVCGLNDLMHAPAINGEPITLTTILVDRQFCKDVLGGVIAYECYNYSCIDSEWTARARRVGKTTWVENSIVEHVHPANGKRQRDALDDEHVVWAADDNALFERRKSLGFPDNMERII